MAGTYPWLVLAPLAGLAAQVAGHVLASWLAGGRKVFLCVVVGFAAGLLAASALSAWALAGMGSGWADGAAFLAFNVVAYLALAYGYVNFVNLNTTSLRIRILQELLAADRGLTMEEILRRYGADELVENRITRLTRRNQIVLRDGRFYPRPSPLLVVARVINFLKFVVLGRRRRRPTAAGPAAVPEGGRPGARAP